jgi:hypothetical protein
LYFYEVSQSVYKILPKFFTVKLRGNIIATLTAKCKNDPKQCQYGMFRVPEHTGSERIFWPVPLYQSCVGSLKATIVYIYDKLIPGHPLRGFQNSSVECEILATTLQKPMHCETHIIIF